MSVSASAGVELTDVETLPAQPSLTPAVRLAFGSSLPGFRPFVLAVVATELVWLCGLVYVIYRVAL